MNPSLLNHLWQSTLFAAVAGVLTLALRRNHARIRYALWLAASLKFLVPFSIFVGLGLQVPPRTVPVIASPTVTSALEAVAEPIQFDSRPARSSIPVTTIR